MNIAGNNLPAELMRQCARRGGGVVFGQTSNKRGGLVRKAWSHERSRTGKDEWLTPPAILQALGPFDLDPCAAVDRPWPTARHHFTIQDDGLSKAWQGRVWLNPPYGSQTGKWLDRLADHGNGVALIFARTDTRMFFAYVWGRAQAVHFLRGRLTFWNVDGTPAAHSGGAPSCLVAYGENNLRALAGSGLAGFLVHLGNKDKGLLA